MAEEMCSIFVRHSVSCRQRSRTSSLEWSSMRPTPNTHHRMDHKHIHNTAIKSTVFTGHVS